jgi:hypothetical protein
VIDGRGVTVRTERRWRYSYAEKSAIVAESLRSYVTVVSVARWHCIVRSVINNFHANRHEAETIVREALGFFPCRQFVKTMERASRFRSRRGWRLCLASGKFLPFSFRPRNSHWNDNLNLEA